MSFIKKKPAIPTRRPAPKEDEASDGGLFFASENTHLKFISSGCTLLDCALGGGWPLGRVSNLVGDKSTGKTLLAIEACANFAHQFPGTQEDILYVEAESAFDASYAEALGLPTKRIRFETGLDTVEELFETIGTFIGADINGGESKKEKLRERPGLIIVDSLDALTDKAEKERKITDGTFGAQKAKLMGQLFRRLVRKLGRTGTHLQIISQVRDAIGVMFGDKHTRSGGKALDFYASQVLWLSLLKTQKQVVQGESRAVGLTIRTRCKKNKIALPLREAEFTLRFGYGVEDIEAGYEFLTKIKKEKECPLRPEQIRKLRGREHREAREAFNKVLKEQWYIFERNFIPARSKYGEE